MSVSRETPGGESGGPVDRRRRRRWSEAQKRQIVSESYEPEGDAGAGRFVPVVVEATPEGGADASTPCPSSRDGVAVDAAAAGRMEIVLAGGRRVIVDRAVDGPALARVLAILARR